jgi:hypothetical protein
MCGYIVSGLQNGREMPHIGGRFPHFDFDVGKETGRHSHCRFFF